MFCVIQNFGTQSARNVKITFDPSPILDDGQKLQDLSIFSQVLPYLPPNEKYWRLLDSTPETLRININPFSILVEYESTSGKKYKDNFIVDFSIMGDLNDPEPSISYQLSKVIDMLGKIEKSNRSTTVSISDSDLNPYA